MGFLERCEEARQAISRMNHVLIVHHYDADGLSGGALAAAALEKMGKDYSRVCYRKLSDRELAEVGARNEKDVIFVDFGAGAIDGIEKLGKNAIVIDHHQGGENSVLQVNPRLFGIDGSTEMSGASTAYFTFAMVELAPIGIVGAVGDIQAPLNGWNRRMLVEAEEAGIVRHYNDLCMFGRVSRPLVPFLQYSIDPYLPGLTNNEQAVLSFYDELGIAIKDGDRWRTYRDLTEQEKTLLRGALAAYLYEKGRAHDAKSLISEVYELTAYPEGTEMRDASEFSTLLNACGRHSKPDVGVDVLLKRPGAYETARALLELHRRMLRQGIEYAERSAVDLGVMYFVDARGVIEDGIIGVVAGMLYGSVRADKPILAVALDADGNVKVSTRATKRLVQSGVNLGRALNVACEGGVGVGGGHDIAAGATVAPEHLNLFLERFGSEIAAQLQV
ncbi:MAG: DHH family phosphoesterase [Candidatus Micrarchaeia archaeon]